MAPGLEVVQEVRLPPALVERYVEEAERAAELREREAEIAERAASTEAVGENFTRRYEQLWVKTPIPALGGLSPQGAAADPEWRSVLIALLDTIRNGPPQPGLMNADRLDALLGLAR